MRRPTRFQTRQKNPANRRNRRRNANRERTRNSRRRSRRRNLTNHEESRRPLLSQWRKRRRRRRRRWWQRRRSRRSERHKNTEGGGRTLPSCRLPVTVVFLYPLSCCHPKHVSVPPKQFCANWNTIPVSPERSCVTQTRFGFLNRSRANRNRFPVSQKRYKRWPRRCCGLRCFSVSIQMKLKQRGRRRVYYSVCKWLRRTDETWCNVMETLAVILKR